MAHTLQARHWPSSPRNVPEGQLGTHVPPTALACLQPPAAGPDANLDAGDVAAANLDPDDRAPGGVQWSAALPSQVSHSSSQRWHTPEPSA